MSRLALLLAVILGQTACKTGSAPRHREEITYHSAAAAEDNLYKPSYDKADLADALTRERTAESASVAKVRELEDSGDGDGLRLAQADLAVRQRFIASLEACNATGLTCPPRLDDPAWSFDVEANVDPKLDSKLRFDLDSWKVMATELHGRACACRTITCVDSMFVAIDRLETRPMPDVQRDEVASLSITRARECLYRLRGLRQTPRVLAGD